MLAPKQSEISHIKRMKRVLLSLVIVIAVWSCQQSATSTQETRLADQLDSLFNAAVANHEVPGAVAYVSQNGEIIYNKAFGMSDIESDKAQKQSDIFRIASMTKSVTAVAILQLVEKGKIFLDDPVSKFIPEFKAPQILVEVFEDSSFSSIPATNEITIHHLLTHTSGIGYGFQSDLYNALVIKHGISEGFEERPIELQENTKRIAGLPLLHEPGAQWTYSLSYDVLGAVVEVASGQKLDQYFYKNILRPLGMNDTYFYLPESKTDRLVSVYEHNDRKDGFIPARYPLTEYPVRGARMYLSGGADLSGTTADIGIFAQMLFNKGSYNGVRILTESSVVTMTSTQSPHGWWDSDIGFGVSVTTSAGASKKLQEEGSFEFGGFYDTFCRVDPVNGYVALLMLQMYPNNEFDVHYKFQNITYSVLANSDKN